MIDVVGYDPSTGEYLLVMIEERTWAGGSEQAGQLRAKIATYTDFVLDGGLQRHYPETAGQKVRLQLDCWTPPSGEAAAIVDEVNVRLAEWDMRLSVHVRQ